MIFSFLDDKFFLNKMIEIPTMAIVVRAVFHENNKYYKLQIIKMIYYDRIDVSEESDVRCIKSVMFVTIGNS